MIVAGTAKSLLAAAAWRMTRPAVTPADAAIARKLTRSNPSMANCAIAAWRILARAVRSDESPSRLTVRMFSNLYVRVGERKGQDGCRSSFAWCLLILVRVLIMGERGSVRGSAF